jgi:ABC-2 type transport system ATP-binding protein
MVPASLHIQSLKKSFGNRVILDQGELKLGSGVHFMIGPNGSGKTTLFKCLAGILPFDGKVVVSGEIDLHKHVMPHRKAVSMCAAEPQFPDYLRGNELLDFVLRSKGWERAGAQKVIDALGMAHFLSQKVGVYSSGMKKKLGLLMALAGPSQVVLLDEPYSALDQPSRRALAGLIRLAVGEGSTFLIASHLADLHAAFGEGDVYLLENTRFRLLGKGEALPWLEKSTQEAILEEGV